MWVIRFNPSIFLPYIFEHLGCYYQGTFTSNNSAHPSGTAKVNITENDDFVNMTLEALDFMVVQVDEVSVDSDNNFPYNIHFKLNTSEQISGTMDIFGGNISIRYSNQQNIGFTIHASK
jgi:hypothetical protein